MQQSKGDKDSTRAVLIRSLGLLDKSDKRKVIAVAVVQIFLSGLDLLGVAVIGVIGALAANGVAQKAPGNRVSAFLELVSLENASLQEQVGILSIVAVVVFIFKTLVTLVLIRRILYYLSRVAARMSSISFEVAFVSTNYFAAKDCSRADVCCDFRRYNGNRRNYRNHHHFDFRHSADDNSYRRFVCC